MAIRLLGARICSVMLVASLILLGTTARCADAQTIPFDSCGWEYTNGPSGVWLPICAPFVRAGACDSTTSFDQMSSESQIFFFRRTINNEQDHPVGAWLLMRFKGTNVRAFLDGVLFIDAGGNNECPPMLVDNMGPLGNPFVLQPGANEIMLRVASSPPALPPALWIGGFLDAQITTAELVTASSKATWGQLKVLYR